MEKAIVIISGTEYKLKFTVGFWKKLKEKCDVTKQNLEAKLNEDFGNVATEIIFYGVLYGAGVDEAASPVTRQQIEAQLDYSAVDAIEQAIIDGMTKVEKRLVELAKRKADKQITEMEEDVSSKKKFQSTST